MRTVTYSLPTASGGTPPIAISCSVASGASFSLGETTVVCTGTDGVHTPGQCPFKVTLVAVIPVLRLTQFLGFGDSISAGENGEDALVQFVDEYNSYEKQLERMLTMRYTSQTPQVILDGISREKASEGRNRIDHDLDALRPQVLLLLEGVNDLSGNLPVDRANIIEGLRYDIQAAKNRGIVVFLSTLMPEDEKPGNRAHNADEIEPVNAAIRGLAAEQNVTLVDTWAAFAGHAHAGDYLDADGLHPTIAGNQATAEAFFAAIESTLEVPPASPASSLRRIHGR